MDAPGQRKQETSPKLKTLVTEFKHAVLGKQVRVSVTQQQQAQQQQQSQQQAEELSQLLAALARQKEQEEAAKKSLWGKRSSGNDDSANADLEALKDTGGVTGKTRQVALDKTLQNCGLKEISQNAYKEIIQYARYFTNGVMPENLPAGFL